MATRGRDAALRNRFASGLPPDQPSDDGPRKLSFRRPTSRELTLITYQEARMLATLGMLLAVSRIVWIIVVVVVVLALLGVFARGR
jgi:hypothetical protein